MEEDLTDFQQRGEEYMIFLALLGCAVLAGITHVHIEGMNYKNPNNEHHKRSEQSLEHFLLNGSLQLLRGEKGNHGLISIPGQNRRRHKDCACQ